MAKGNLTIQILYRFFTGLIVWIIVGTSGAFFAIISAESAYGSLSNLSQPSRVFVFFSGYFGGISGSFSGAFFGSFLADWQRKNKRRLGVLGRAVVGSLLGILFGALFGVVAGVFLRNRGGRGSDQIFIPIILGFCGGMIGSVLSGLIHRPNVRGMYPNA